MSDKNEYVALGLMSGTSLDGLDMALCRFRLSDGHWSYEVLKSETLPYTKEWQCRLADARELTIDNLVWFDRDFGTFMGEKVNAFLENSQPKPELLASHGHTIIHRPEFGFTSQLGHGASLAATTGLPVVNDFRSLDIALNGQGAPLVPVGDEYLFPDYRACLNLGGIANVSHGAPGGRVAWDICPVNMLLNHLAGKEDKSFDKDGQGARHGKTIPLLLEKLNSLPYYQADKPKSLGKEWFDSQMKPLFEIKDVPLADLYFTAYEHISHILSIELSRIGGKILVSGGGTLNRYLMKKLQQTCKAELFIPHPEIIHFKEAVIFAFLGVLRVRKEINTFASATGATRDSCGGCIWNS